MAKILEMPKLSPTMEEGVLTAWHKKEGDAIAIDDLLAEVETNKATMEFRSFDKGTLLKLLVEPGATVKLGQPVAVVGAPGEDVTQISPAAKPPTAPKPAVPAPAEAKEDVLPNTHADGGAGAISVPSALPASMQDRVSTFLQSHAPPPVASSAGAMTPAPAGERAPKAQGGSILDRTEREGERTPRTSGASEGERVMASPFVRKQARELGVDLRGAKGSGPGGRIALSDLSSLAPTALGAPQTAIVRAPATLEAQPNLVTSGRPAPESRPLSMMRKTIARRLTESKTTVPHFYLTIDVDVAALTAFREQLNAEVAKDEGAIKISINDLLIKACALGLRRVPECNAQFSPEAILVHKRVDISVAVAVPEGLVTPVVRDADQLSISAIAAKVRDLAARAKQKKLRPEEMTDGTFSISNLGMFGIDEFAAVINPPEGAILAVGRVRDEPVVKDGAVIAGKKLALTLSCDHRVVDGAIGAAFLAEVRALLERPIRILTG
ncbi:pyruvate dehydrogenase complex dihydrolipoamide acetyltransferase [soil metagenome]